MREIEQGTEDTHACTQHYKGPEQRQKEDRHFLGRTRPVRFARSCKNPIASEASTYMANELSSTPYCRNHRSVLRRGKIE